MKSMYGDDYRGGKVYGIDMNGLYEEGGTMITDDDITDEWWERGLHGAATLAPVGTAGGLYFGGVGALPGTIIGAGAGFVSGALGWNPYGEEPTMDLEYSGTYLALRIKGLDGQTGRPTSALLTRDSNEKDIRKLRQNYGDREVEVVMVNELMDPDWPTSDDVYYDVIEMGDIAFRDQMEENTNSANLSKVYNDSLSYEAKKENEAWIQKQKDRLNIKLADMFTEGNTEILPEVANSYKHAVDTSLVAGGIPIQTAQQNSAVVLSYLLTEANKQAGEDNQKQNELLQVSTRNFSSILNSSQASDMKDALKTGPKAFINWYSKNTDKETFNKFVSLNKNWSKYFSLENQTR
jgi:hypothetical protein